MTFATVGRLLPVIPADAVRCTSKNFVTLALIRMRIQRKNFGAWLKVMELASEKEEEARRLRQSYIEQLEQQASRELALVNCTFASLRLLHTNAKLHVHVYTLLQNMCVPVCCNWGWVCVCVCVCV